MDSMRLLQKAVHHRKTANEDEIQNEKNIFEQNKKVLDNAIQSIQKEIIESTKEVINQGDQFGQLKTPVKDTRTKESLNKMKNMLHF